MKFGLIDFDLTVESYWSGSWNNKALLNVGDAAEYLVVEQLYRTLGIDEERIVRLNIGELINYRGESLIVALNIALDSYVGYNNILDALSPDIIPVFLGMSFTKPELTPPQIEVLKKYSPIGCRDERSFLTLRSLNIPCYLNGCMASVVQLNEIQPYQNIENKILFIDVPAGVSDFVPDEIKKDIIFVNQEIYIKKSDLPNNFIPKEWAYSIMRYYKSKPRLIVTSRFHGAVLALANNIPAILTLEKNTFRFSWIQNYYPIYTEEVFSEINWEIKPVNYTPVADLMISTAKKRLIDTINQHQNLLQLTDIQRCKDEHVKESTNQVLYYQKVLAQIRDMWDRETQYTYGFWGVNDNTKKLYEHLSVEFPNARLVDVFDMFQPVSFNGIFSRHPKELSKRAKQDNYYVIVTAYLASRVAPDIFEEVCFPQNRSFLCTRDFMNEQSLH